MIPQPIKPKKNLGQNFFINKNLAKKIVEITLKNSPNYLIEIGPGYGSFTSLFAEKLPQNNIIVIEKDNEIAEKWSAHYPDIKLINKDILKVEFDSILKLNLENDQTVTSAINKQNAIIPRETVVFGSLPYYISKKIIKKCLKESRISDFYFIIQKEVAKKYEEHKTSEDYETNPLGITTHLYADIKTFFDIKPGSFNPAPKVNSTFIKLKRKPERIQNLEKELPNFREEEFSDFVYSCFKHPRKTLRNNLKKSKNKNLIKITLEDTLKKRPGDLGYNEYIQLFKALKLENNNIQ